MRQLLQFLEELLWDNLLEEPSQQSFQAFLTSEKVTFFKVEGKGFGFAEEMKRSFDGFLCVPPGLW